MGKNRHGVWDRVCM